MSRSDIKDATDFREAIIGIANYMAITEHEVCTLSEPIEVNWGFEKKRLVLPTIALADRTEY